MLRLDTGWSTKSVVSGRRPQGERVHLLWASVISCLKHISHVSKCICLVKLGENVTKPHFYPLSHCCSWLLLFSFLMFLLHLKAMCFFPFLVLTGGHDRKQQLIRWKDLQDNNNLNTGTHGAWLYLSSVVWQFKVWTSSPSLPSLHHLSLSLGQAWTFGRGQCML